jgi:hypothetical protein
MSGADSKFLECFYSQDQNECSRTRIGAERPIIGTLVIER